MKTLLKYINEHFINDLSKEDMKKHIDIVWDMLVKGYEKIGGLHGMNSKKQLIDETDMWKMIRKNEKILAVKCYTFKRGGRKACYCTSDGTEDGKNALYQLIKDDMRLKDRKAWIEASGAVEHIYKKYGEATPIPAEIAQQIMKDKEFIKINKDGYHYTRLIGGEPHEKIMLGNFTGK
jgi:hypothetical protein